MEIITVKDKSTYPRIPELDFTNQIVPKTVFGGGFLLSVYSKSH